MTSGACFKFDVSHYAVMVLLVLEAIVVITRVPLLKLQRQGSKIVLPSCALYLADLGQYLYSKGSCLRISALEQLPATMV